MSASLQNLRRAAIRTLIGATALGFSTSALIAADLVIGQKDPPLTVDPHSSVSYATQKLNLEIFEPLIRKDIDSNIVPRLAESWEIVNDTTWVFKLRKDVKFSDGTPFTADDVVFSYARAAAGVPGISQSYVSILKPIKVEAADTNTVRFITQVPTPGLLDVVNQVLILSKKAGEGASAEDFANAKATIGTGPYRLQSFTLNDTAVLLKNPTYWGAKEPWDKVTYKTISNDSSRLAALLSGDVDVIEFVPSQEIDRLKTQPNIAIWERPTPQFAYLGLDYNEDALESGKITGPSGEKLDKNPLADARVRQAIKLSLDLDAFVTKVNQNQVTATGQFFPPGHPDHYPDVQPAKGDAAKARQLLEQSGWAGKFKLDISVASTLFPNAVASAEAIAQSLTRIGIPTQVTNLAYQVYLKDRLDKKIPVSVSIFQNTTGTPEYMYANFMHSRDTNRGFGTFNFARYTNPKFDEIIETAGVTMDAAKRKPMYREALRIAIEDNGVIPMWFTIGAAASKKGIVVKLRSSDAYLYPSNIRAGG